MKHWLILLALLPLLAACGAPITVEPPVAAAAPDITSPPAPTAPAPTAAIFHTRPNPTDTPTAVPPTVPPATPTQLPYDPTALALVLTPAAPPPDLVPATPIAAPAPGWIEYSSQAGRFRIFMPSRPTEQSERLDTEAGQIEQHTAIAGNAASAYITAYVDYPKQAASQADPQQVLDAALEGLKDRSESRILKEEKITLDGYPGRALDLEAPKEGIMLRFQARLYLVHERLYQLLVVTESQNAAGANAGYFLDSFKLLDRTKGR